MQTGQQLSSEVVSSANGASAMHDLFALTDEQILEIEPEAQDVQVSSSPQPAAASGQPNERGPETRSTQAQSAASAAQALPASGQAGLAVAQEPPAWLAAQMKDPWTGEEAKELWNGILQAQKEAADYRAAIATPEDARALKELYPGGVNEARAMAERARVLDDFDRAYFGAAGNSAEQTSASRAQLAAKMLREDPAAFREMVFAGLRALEESSPQPGSNVGSRFSATSTAQSGAAETQGGLKSAPTNTVGQAQTGERARGHEAELAAYAAFEKAANEDLERAVGGTIERTLEQALPNLGKREGASTVGARTIVPLHERLGVAIRQDVEAALKGDRQLSEQVAQILSGRRLDNETRVQVVRLIGERAQQLVPIAAKRVLGEWTQTTLAAHRGKTERADAALARREVAPVASPAVFPRAAGRERIAESSPIANRARAVDYRKLSDEQILEM